MATFANVFWTVIGISFLHFFIALATETKDEIAPVDKDLVNDQANEDIKRHIGRWKNAKWIRENRNIGRWKNRNWEMSQRLHDGDSEDRELVKRSYPDLDMEGAPMSDLNMYPSLDMYGEQPIYYGGMEKRLNSRWALIHRKLEELNRNSNKRDMDADKRHSSRWQLIHRKLQELENASKNST